MVGDHTPVGEGWAVEHVVADLEWMERLAKGLLGDWALLGIRRLWCLVFLGRSLDSRFGSEAELGRGYSLIVGVLREEPALGQGR